MKAVVLLSGGLDSSLALKMIVDQGIEVLALYFTSLFDSGKANKLVRGSYAHKVADSLGIALKTIRMGQDYLDMIKNPPHSYGSNLNPCIDCRIMQFVCAKKIMTEIGASFIVTGEVVGQRPMSQKKGTIAFIEKESGLTDLIVRPLSAVILSPSLPEREGWVDREKFLKIHGRGRTQQIKLAADLGIDKYSCPAGGCLLTDSNFCRRVKDLIKFGEFDLFNAELLNVGRHFRLSPDFKLVVARNETEGNFLRKVFKPNHTLFEPTTLSGPTGLGIGKINDSIKIKSVEIIVRYTDLNNEVEVTITENGTQQILTASDVNQVQIELLLV